MARKWRIVARLIIVVKVEGGAMQARTASVTMMNVGITMEITLGDVVLMGVTVEGKGVQEAVVVAAVTGVVAGLHTEVVDAFSVSGYRMP